MANNRMYMRCKNCGRRIYIAAHFGGDWEIVGDLDERMGFLFDMHFLDCYSRGNFEIVYETDEFSEVKD